MYWSSADFSDWFRLRGKSSKIYDILVSEKSKFFNFFFFWGGVTNSQPSFLWVRQSFVKNCMLYNKVVKLYSGSMLQLYFGEQMFWKKKTLYSNTSRHMQRRTDHTTKRPWQFSKQISASCISSLQYAFPVTYNSEDYRME